MVPGSLLSYTRTSSAQPRALPLKSSEAASPAPAIPPPMMATLEPLASLLPFIRALAPPSLGPLGVLGLSVPLNLGGRNLRCPAVHHHPIAPLALGLVE